MTRAWIAALLVSFVSVASSAEAQPAPYHRYRTLETPHFRVHAPSGLEREGRVAGAAAERAYMLLSRELHEPRGKVDIVVSDDADYSNGYATPLPTNRIVIFATPPIESGPLRLNEDWIQLVITHELAHIFHLDRTRGLWKVAQNIFGRAPALFPNLYGPSWLTEGLAVYYESKLTEGGRLRDAEHRLIARTSALEGRLPQLHEISLGSPVFPGGQRSYAYGSLFVEYLANTYGDTTLRTFVDKQSNTLIPFRLNSDARHAFGVAFEDAFSRWRDSVRNSVSALKAPLPGWRELTRHGYYAVDPRWLSDSLLIYAGTDGRTMPGEFTITLNGERHRTGRRNSLGPSVRMPDGTLLFAQLDYSAPQEVRSNLYLERNGRQYRLTNDMRLVQPDARSDGTIVAVQLDAARSSLMLLNPDATQTRLLRDAAPDETWSEPRWSPDGRYIAVVHRPHGGVFSLEVIDVATGGAWTLDQGRYLITSPSWSGAGNTVFYTTERSGAPALASASLVRPNPDAPVTITRGRSDTDNIFTPEQSPRSDLLAAVTLRADGFHLGVAPTGALPVRADGEAARNELPATTPQSLAEGEYRRYSPWRSVLPRYWYPIIEEAPGRGLRLGASSDGHDVIGRHLWDGFFTVPTTGSYPTGRFTYRYAGFKRPLIDASVTQDYTAELELTNGGTGTHEGTLLRRTQTASLAASFVRPRYRSFSAFGFGGAIEKRSFVSDPGQFLKQLDTAYGKRYTFPSLFVSGQWSNLQRPALSISPEDGIALAFTARDRWRSDVVGASRSLSVVGTAAAYKSLDLPGFAHHVLALRLAGGIADKRAASSFQVGGTSGSTVKIITGYTVGEGRRTFGVRGFPAAAVYGTQAGAASLEYRMPAKISARGFGILPFFADRSSVSAFADVGVANCADDPYVPSVCAPARFLGKTIASVGLEAVQSAAILDYDAPQQLRIGIAAPVAGKDLVSVRPVSIYLAYGLSF